MSITSSPYEFKRDWNCAAITLTLVFNSGRQSLIWCISNLFRVLAKNGVPFLVAKVGYFLLEKKVFKYFFTRFTEENSKYQLEEVVIYCTFIKWKYIFLVYQIKISGLPQNFMHTFWIKAIRSISLLNQIKQSCECLNIAGHYHNLPICTG